MRKLTQDEVYPQLGPLSAGAGASARFLCFRARPLTTKLQLPPWWTVQITLGYECFRNVLKYFSFFLRLELMVNEHILILWHCFENMEFFSVWPLIFYYRFFLENVFYFSNICPKSSLERIYQVLLWGIRHSFEEGRCQKLVLFNVKSLNK